MALEQSWLSTCLLPQICCCQQAARADQHIHKAECTLHRHALGEDGTLHVTSQATSVLEY